MTLAVVVFSNTVWTFWDVMLLFFVFIPLIMLWFFAIFDVFGRRDLNGLEKVVWLLAIVILPWFGTLLYLIFRPLRNYASDVSLEDSRSQAPAENQPTPA